MLLDCSKWKVPAESFVEIILAGCLDFLLTFSIRPPDTLLTSPCGQYWFVCALSKSSFSSTICLLDGKS